MAEAALSQINTAFEVMRDGGEARFAEYYEGQLPKARALVALCRSPRKVVVIGMATECSRPARLSWI
jgi:hypothetical protein